MGCMHLLDTEQLLKSGNQIGQAILICFTLILMQYLLFITATIERLTKLRHHQKECSMI